MDKCPNCGAKVYSSDKRCSKCGQELKKGASGSVIAIILIVILIAVVGILASVSNTNNTQADVAVASDSYSSADSVEQSTSSDDYVQESSSSQDQSSYSGTEYWASSESDKFHKPSCEWAQKINSYNKIVYHSRQEAINDGRIPCHVCYP